MNHRHPPEIPQRPMPLYPKATAATKRRRFRIDPYAWIPTAAVAGIALLGVVVVANDNPARSAAAAGDRAAVPSSQPGPPIRKPVELAPPVPTSMDGDGIYVVGREIKPGRYKAGGFAGCYWARLSNLAGDDHDVIANWYGNGRVTVEIRLGDKGFETNNCGPWEMVK